MIAKFEECVRPFGVVYEYVNMDNVFKIIIGRKRIKLYTHANPFFYVYVGKTEHNLRQLRKFDKNIEWE